MTKSKRHPANKHKNHSNSTQRTITMASTRLEQEMPYKGKSPQKEDENTLKLQPSKKWKNKKED
uniref:Uncharacterized protein n=1 Tax=Rhizophora mucronata TaxID=61149 RepID=A0A2P2IN50_RHIMU